MEERRIVCQFGITYDTPYEHVKQVLDIVHELFSDIPDGRLDRAHFTTFADSSLLFEVVYYVNTSDYTKYLDIQQEFNFGLMRRFAELGIEFAYPTQTIYTKAIS
jgi:small-conductance mechanosensitive channel